FILLFSPSCVCPPRPPVLLCTLILLLPSSVCVRLHVCERLCVCALLGCSYALCVCESVCVCVCDVNLLCLLKVKSLRQPSQSPKKQQRPTGSKVKKV